ncbi:MAG: hypothetical protein LAN63_13860 [Acidobacteriia bacterium]|nr:hypothetical protein [Terriglobia bacterium]
MKRMMAVFTAAILSLVLCASFAVFAAPAPAPAPPEGQPEMTSALEHLREAKRALESASHDKGGHRAKAISLVNQAIAQVEEGIRYDNTHTSPGERKH